MKENVFHPFNPRVRKASLKARLSNPFVRIINILLFLIFVAGGGALIYLKNPLGWIPCGFSVIFLMTNFWIKNALSEIPIGKTNNITDILSEDLLMPFKKVSSLKDLASVLVKTTSSSFLMIRFMLPAQFLDFLASQNSSSLEEIFKTARKIQQDTDSEEITGAILIIAIIESTPNYESILNRLKLSLPDLYQGVIWFNYLNGIVKSSKTPVRSGGIARDFAFGYTPTLQRFATNVSNRSAGARTKLQQANNQKVVDQIISNLTSGNRRNAALIGNYGSGRTTMINYLAETLLNASSKVPRSLKFSQIYSLDAPSLISAASNPGEIEYTMIRIFNEAYAAKNIILCLDDAHLFFETGPGSVDISNSLLPILEAGNIRVVLIMDKQKFLEISARNPAFANALNVIQLEPTNHEETLKVLMDQAPVLEYQKKVIYTYPSLTEAYRLSEQYVHDVEMPGKAKLLLQSAANFAENGLVTDLSVQIAIEKTYGVKVKVVDTEEDRDKLLNLEQLIHERMVDQEEAVSAVSNALRRAAAGVKNSGRPIGTFLFVGPTGVGKTELAKAISEVYFNGEENIIRLDMNEFVSASDVSRLIRDGASDSLSLTAQVMKQPFSVVLLDEIEKAHPSVITTLLQVLDEGILRDEKNREVSFCDTIIIVTSNAGANEIREKITAGVKIEDFKEEFIDNLIKSGEFKPEFLNRFDETCLFKPLSKDDLLKILDLIINSVNKSLAQQKISVSLDDATKSLLVEKGYDPKMGARPMRRIVQKNVENVVATAILSGKATPGSTLKITADEIDIAQ
ncbi:ATP-dependent Clp protease ATP-binding subunit [Candidatus Saccharibacteria bacterium]|nr:ATP-dependent Clp protease ATP-binding subunit [Candidatus Saccharibacteria bacterium]